MPKKPEEWITSKKAAEILTANSGHNVSTNYVRLLGNTGKLETKEIDGRTKLYLKRDVEDYEVRAKKTKPAPGARQYSEEQRKQALLLVGEGMSNRQAAKELGISYQVINNWVKQELLKAAS